MSSTSERRQKYHERARDKARERRCSSKTLMEDLSFELPFPKGVIDSLDQSSRLRLAMCYIKMKTLFNTTDNKSPSLSPAGSEPFPTFSDPTSDPILQRHVSADNSQRQVSFPLMHRGGGGGVNGILQDLFMESLDGFLLVYQKDGSILYLSDSIHKYLGLFQSDLVGQHLSSLIHEYDMWNVVTQSLECSYVRLLGDRGYVDCSFFCRMKCSDRKGTETTNLHSQNYKLVYFSGQVKLQADGTTLLMGVASPVTPPTLIELDVRDNMFVSHYSLDMRCIYFDGRLTRLIGYEHNDLIGHVPFEIHHHDDMEVTLKCSQELMERGEGMTGYYRMLTKSGRYVWLQSRATIVYDRRTKAPSYVFCVNYLIVDDTITSKDIKRTLEPVPVTNGENGILPLSPFPLSPTYSSSSSSMSAN